MPSDLGYQFDRLFSKPIETNRQVQTINERDEIDENKRWEGMLVYVTSDESTYELRGGVSNAYWEKLTSITIENTDDLPQGDDNLYMTDEEKDKLTRISINNNIDLDALVSTVNSLNGGVNLQGEIQASSGSFPANTSKGDMYVFSDEGNVNGIDFVAGDSIISEVDNASTTDASQWIVIRNTNNVNSVVGLQGNITRNALLYALGVEAGATRDMSGREIDEALTAYFQNDNWKTYRNRKEITDLIASSFRYSDSANNNERNISVNYVNDKFVFESPDLIYKTNNANSLKVASFFENEKIIVEILDAKNFKGLRGGKAWVRYNGGLENNENDFDLLFHEQPKNLLNEYTPNLEVMNHTLIDSLKNDWVIPDAVQNNSDTASYTQGDSFYFNNPDDGRNSENNINLATYSKPIKVSPGFKYKIDIGSALDGGSLEGKVKIGMFSGAARAELVEGGDTFDLENYEIPTPVFQFNNFIDDNNEAFVSVYYEKKGSEPNEGYLEFSIFDFKVTTDDTSYIKPELKKLKDYYAAQNYNRFIATNMPVYQVERYSSEIGKFGGKILKHFSLRKPLYSKYSLSNIVLDTSEYISIIDVHIVEVYKNGYQKVLGNSPEENYQVLQGNLIKIKTLKSKFNSIDEVSEYRINLKYVDEEERVPNAFLPDYYRPNVYIADINQGHSDDTVNTFLDVYNVLYGNDFNGSLVESLKTDLISGSYEATAASLDCDMYTGGLTALHGRMLRNTMLDGVFYVTPHGYNTDNLERNWGDKDKDFRDSGLVFSAGEQADLPNQWDSSYGNTVETYEPTGNGAYLTSKYGNIADYWGNTGSGSSDQSPATSIIAAKLKYIRDETLANYQKIRLACWRTAKDENDNLRNGEWDNKRGYGIFDAQAAVSWINDNPNLEITTIQQALDYMEENPL